MMAHRCAACYFVTCMLFVVCVLRVFSAATGASTAAGNTGGRYTLVLTRPRGTIYDCGGIPLNNRSERILAAVSPSPQTVAALRSVLGDNPSLTGILTRLSGGRPVICELPRMIDCEGIVCLRVSDADTADKPAVHTVGYTDSSGHGVSGLEAAFDDLLYSEQTVNASFEIDGSGAVLTGGGITLEGAQENPNALYTTLDSEIQRIAERSTAQIACGAAVVCEVGTGKLRAVVSRPDFDCTDIAQYLDRADAPLLNRALTAYSVGSVFKPCVAAAGLESGAGALSFECAGSTEIAGRSFHCHRLEGHGSLTLGGALAASCNIYFYRFALAVGAEPIYEKASALNFGSSFELAPGLASAAGQLPSLSSLRNDAALANLSIGQGTLLLSPAAMLTLYCAIAGDGGYYLPHIVEKQVSRGETKRLSNGKKTAVMQPETARLLREYLTEVVLTGTGTAAAPTLCTAAGKTATAQTGRYDENGREINLGWFCGFFPAESPRYAVAVMIEDANGYDAAPVFAAIADGITALENGQPQMQ